MIHGITFTDDKMTRSAELCRSSMLKNGVDECKIYLSIDISSDFRHLNNEILSQPRGVGYWLWKPYFIYKTMLDVPDGSYVIYSDAGVEFISPVQPVIEAMGDEDVFLFSNRWLHVEWCKGDVYRKINYSDMTESVEAPDEYYKQEPQVQASNIFIRVTEKSKAFIKEWLLWCQMPGFLDDSPSLNNYPTFAEHRHDQAVLCCLAIREGMGLHWFPATTNLDRLEQGDNYPAMFNYHRKRNNEW